MLQTLSGFFFSLAMMSLASAPSPTRMWRALYSLPVLWGFELFVLGFQHVVADALFLNNLHEGLTRTDCLLSSSRSDTSGALSKPFLMLPA